MQKCRNQEKFNFSILSQKTHNTIIRLHLWKQQFHGPDRAAKLTTGFDLTNVVTWKPARFAVERALPPSSLLLACHKDHFTFTEWQLILIILLEVEASLYHQLPTSTVLRHFLFRKVVTAWKQNIQMHQQVSIIRFRYLTNGWFIFKQFSCYFKIWLKKLNQEIYGSNFIFLRFAIIV